MTIYFVRLKDGSFFSSKFGHSQKITPFNTKKGVIISIFKKLSLQCCPLQELEKTLDGVFVYTVDLENSILNKMSGYDFILEQVAIRMNKIKNKELRMYSGFFICEKCGMFYLKSSYILRNNLIICENCRKKFYF